VRKFDKHATLLAARRPKDANASRFSGLLASLLAEAVGIALCVLAFSLPLQEVSSESALLPIKKPSFKDYAKHKIQSEKQFVCLNKLWSKESAWKVNAINSYGTAYGIPQLKNKIMLSADGYTQINYGLKYIAHRYGTTKDGYINACKAWQHFQARNWH
jgi:hypothetical protein